MMALHVQALSVRTRLHMTNETSVTDGRTNEVGRENPASVAERSIVAALDEHATPLATTDPASDRRDLDFLPKPLTNARVVGLGEATHGSREFFALKHRLLRQLVCEHGCRVFGIEANFAAVLALDEYVVHGSVNPRTALGNVPWTWNVESVLAMVEWLRTFNANRPLDDRVRVYGLDATYSHGAVDALVAFFERVDPTFCRRIRNDLDAADDNRSLPLDAEALRTGVEAAEKVVPKLRDRLDENRETYVTETSKRSWELAQQHVTIVEQAAAYKNARLDRARDEVDEKTAIERCLQCRDRAMANNIEWLFDHESADSIAIWAHDAHINRSEQKPPRWQPDAVAPSLGSYLADRFGDEYYALGFSFGHGAFQARSEVEGSDSDEADYELRRQTLEKPLSNTIDATLAKLDHPLAVVDLRAASGDDRIAEWLSEPWRHFSVGGIYDPKNPEKYVAEYVYGTAFDGICYVDETRRASPIEQG